MENDPAGPPPLHMENSICLTVIFFESFPKWRTINSLIHFSKKCMLYTQGANANFGFTEFTQEVCHCPGHQGNCGKLPQCSVKSWNSGFLKKIIFSNFWGKKMRLILVLRGQNNFWRDLNHFSASANMVWGHSHFFNSFIWGMILVKIAKKVRNYVLD